MQNRAVIVDVAVDQGGCVETSKPTTHDDPTFVVDGVVHYCVANMPGAVSVTSTLALTSITLQYGLQIADKGLEKACKENEVLRRGLNVYKGHCVHAEVASTFGITYKDAHSVL
ncbi:hypothetical protein MASR2M78_35340 [Treponema sp.]